MKTHFDNEGNLCLRTENSAEKFTLKQLLKEKKLSIKEEGTAFLGVCDYYILQPQEQTCDEKVEENRTKIYHVEFDGCYLSIPGTAIVRAHTIDEAKKLVEKEMVDPEGHIESIKQISDKEAILYFYNGDY